MSIDPDTSIQEPGQIAAENAAVLLPAVAFLLNLAAGYALVTPACRASSQVMLHVVHAVCLALALVGGIVAFRVLGRAHQAPPSLPLPSRSLFLGRAGLLSSALFVMVIIAQWIPELFIDPCRQA